MTSSAASSCIQPSGWCQSANLRVTAECAVAALSVVVLNPRGNGGGAVIVTRECLPIGPLGGQGAIEAFSLVMSREVVEVQATARVGVHVRGAIV